MKKKYFHEIPQEEINNLIQKNRTYKYLAENYLQPSWCTYPEALDPELGCWSLMDFTPEGIRNKISEDYCRLCENFKNPEDG